MCKMDTVAKRRGEEWVREVAKFLVANDLEDPEDLDGADPRRLNGTDKVHEVKMAALLRVVEKTTETAKNNRTASSSGGGAEVAAELVKLIQKPEPEKVGDRLDE